jgi:AcrR family transcriptional regulator
VSAKESGQLVTVRPDRYDRRRQRTREAILTAAVDAFRRKGVADTTIGDITQSADIAYRTFYNHFDSLEDVISAVAEMTLARVVDMTDELLPDDDFLDLIPAVSVRLIMRLLSTDPTVRWMLERPYIFVDEWRKIVTPSMRSFADLDPDLPVFQAIGGVETWIRVFPWTRPGAPPSSTNHADWWIPSTFSRPPPQGPERGVQTPRIQGANLQSQVPRLFSKRHREELGQKSCGC